MEHLPLIISLEIHTNLWGSLQLPSEFFCARIISSQKKHLNLSSAYVSLILIIFMPAHIEFQRSCTTPGSTVLRLRRYPAGI